MVVALGPGKFYGSSLPRPRFYTDVKLNSERVDPPPPVMDPLMKWAEEAHWSMGGLNFKRVRFQGRIEGNVEKLRAQRESTFRKSQKQHQKSAKRSTSSKNGDNCEISKTPSPPPAPVAIKRRRVVGLFDEDEDFGEPKRGAVRKLGDDFDRVATESGIAVGKADGSGGSGGSTRNEAAKQRRKLVKGSGKVGAAAAPAAAGVRKSPRLSRKRSN